MTYYEIASNTHGRIDLRTGQLDDRLVLWPAAAADHVHSSGPAPDNPHLPRPILRRARELLGCPLARSICRVIRNLTGRGAR
jgi:hypothetical protein